VGRALLMRRTCRTIAGFSTPMFKVLNAVDERRMFVVVVVVVVSIDEVRSTAVEERCTGVVTLDLSALTLECTGVDDIVLSPSLSKMIKRKERDEKKGRKEG
jgi:hypothetical protein